MVEFPYEAIALMRYKSPPGQPPFILLKDTKLTITGGDEDWLTGILKQKVNDDDDETSLEIVIPAQFVEKIESSTIETVGDVKGEEEVKVIEEKVAEPEVKEEVPIKEKEIIASTDNEQQESNTTLTGPVATPAILTPIITQPESPKLTATSTPSIISPSLSTIISPLSTTSASGLPPSPSISSPTLIKSSVIAPDTPAKPLSLRDRIAALNAAGAGALSPSSGPLPPAPRPKPTFVRKAPVTTPVSPNSSTTSSNSPIISTSTSIPIDSSSISTSSVSGSKSNSEMNPQDAMDSIKKGGTLKERMLALQGLQLDNTSVPPLPGRAPKVWKRKQEPVVVPVEEEEKEVIVQKVGDEIQSEEKNVISTPTVDSVDKVDESTDNAASTESESIEVVNEEETEESKKAALINRMASLGGQRVGMTMPSIPKRTAGPPKRRAPVAVVVPLEKEVEKEEVVESKVEEQETNDVKEDDVEEKTAEDNTTLPLTSVISEPEGELIAKKELKEEDLPPRPTAPVPTSIKTLAVPDVKEEGVETSPISPLSKAIKEVLDPTPTSTTETIVDSPTKEAVASTLIQEESVVKDDVSATVEEEESEEKEEEEEEEEEGEVESDESFEVINEVEGEEHYSHQEPTEKGQETEELNEPEYKEEEKLEEEIEDEPEIVTLPPPPPPIISTRPPVPSGRPAIPTTSTSLPPLPNKLVDREISVAPTRPVVPIPTLPRSESISVESGKEEEEDEDKVVENDDQVQGVEKEEDEVNEGEEEEEQEEEDPEVARRAALAKRMAALGGMNMRMGPMMPPIGGLRKPTKSNSTSSDTNEEVSSPTTRRVGGIPTGGMLMPGMMPKVPQAPVVDPVEPVEDEEVQEVAIPVEEEEEEEVAETLEPEVEDESIPPPLPKGRPPVPSSSNSLPPPPPSRSVPVPVIPQGAPPALPSGRPILPPIIPTPQLQEHFVDEPNEYEERTHEEEEEELAYLTKEDTLPRDSSVSSFQSIPTSPNRSSFSPISPTSPPPSRQLPSLGNSFSEQDNVLPVVPSSHSRNKSIAQSERSFSQSIQSADSLPIPSLAQLLEFSIKYGSQIFAAGHGQKNNKQSSDVAFVELCFSRATEILPPNKFSYGVPIFTVSTSTSNKAINANINQLDEPRSGDIVVFTEAKFKHNLTTIKVGTIEKPHISIVESWDGKKRKVKVLEVAKDGGLEEGGYRMEELKGGKVTIFRVIPKSYVE